MKNIILLVLGIFVAGMAAYAIPYDLKKSDKQEHRTALISFNGHSDYAVTASHVTNIGIAHYCMWRDSHLSTTFEFIKTSETIFVPIFKIINGKRPRYLSRGNLAYNYHRQKDNMELKLG